MAQAVKKYLDDLTLFNVQLIFKNFQGAEKPFNPAGQRNFSILIGPDDAEAMLKDGWNIKFLNKRPDDDPNEPQQAHLPVKINLNSGRPPRIVMVTSKGKQLLDKDMVAALDYVVMKEVDLIINPYSWNVQGKSGITAYCKSLYVTIEEDALDKKYADVPEIDSVENQLAIDSGDVWEQPEDLGEIEDPRTIEQGF